MKKFALVLTNYGYCVMLYIDWLEFGGGCVMRSSNNRQELEEEAIWRNDPGLEDLDYDIHEEEEE